MVRNSVRCACVNIYSLIPSNLSVKFLLPSTSIAVKIQSLCLHNVVSFVADFPIQSNCYVFIKYCKKP